MADEVTDREAALERCRRDVKGWDITDDVVFRIAWSACYASLSSELAELESLRRLTREALAAGDTRT